MRAALLGMGKIGSGVYEQLAGREDITIEKVLDIRPIKGMEDRQVYHFEEIENDKSIDTVVELMGGKEPAHSFALRAIRSGKNFVSANKHMLARFLPELTAECEKNGVEIRYSAAVGGGIPYLYNLLRLKRSDDILCVSGIVNGTTNYILDLMQSESASFDDVLKKAQEMGYAESDPTNDIEGMDAANKLALMCDLAFDCSIDPEMIMREGIKDISRQDVALFAQMGKVVRYIVKGEKTRNGIRAFAMPVLLDRDDMFAAVKRNFNMIGVTGRSAGELCFYGQGAGKDPTACAVVNDLTDIGRENRAVTFRADGFRELPLISDEGVYYIRCALRPDFAAERVGEDAYITRSVSAEELSGFLSTVRLTGKAFAARMGR